MPQRQTLTQGRIAIAAGLAIAAISLTAPPARATTITRTMKFPAFHEIVASGHFRIDLQTNKPQEVEIIADADAFKNVEAKVENGTLHLKTKSEGFSWLHLFQHVFQHRKPVRFIITAPMITSIRNSGACDIYGTALKGKELDLDFSGATKGQFSGSVSTFRVDMSGAGSLDAKNLRADDVNLQMSGAGKVKVTAEKHLGIEASGVGAIEYWGNPKVDQDVSGVCSVKKQD